MQLVLLGGRVKLRSREVEGWKSQQKKSEKTPGREKKAEQDKAFALSRFWPKSQRCPLLCKQCGK